MYVSSILLMITVFSATAEDISAKVNVKSGAIFVQKGDIKISNYNYHVFLNLNIEGIDNEFKHICEAFDTIKSLSMNDKQEDNEKNDVYFDMIKSNVDDYRNEFVDFVDSIPKRSRLKKSWFDGGGSILNTVFGVLDQNTLNNINKKFTIVDEQNNEIISKTMFIQKGLENRITANTRTIKNITAKIVTKMQEMIKESQKVEENVFKQIGVYHAKNQHMLMISEFSSAVLNARLDIAKYRQAIDRSVTHKLSYDVLKPEELITMLNKIKQKIEFPNEMIAPIDHNNLYIYYETITVAVFGNAQNINIVLKIPIVNKNLIFEMYEIQTIPIFWLQSGKFAKLNTEKYIYVNVKNSKYFSTTDPLECDGINICEYNGLIYDTTYETCEINLYLNRKTQMCDVDIVLSHKPHIVRTDFGIVYSVAGKEVVFILCNNRQGYVHTKNIELEHSGILKNCENCIIQGKSFISLPTQNAYLHNMSSNITTSHISQVIIEPMSFHYNNTNISTNTLREIISKIDVNEGHIIPIKRINNKIATELMFNQQFGYNAAISFSTAITFVIIGVVVCYFVYKKCKCVSGNVRRAEDITIRIDAIKDLPPPPADIVVEP